MCCGMVGGARHSLHGFTLLELLLALALVSALVMVVPVDFSAHREPGLSHSAHELAALLGRARGQARAQSTQTLFQMDLEKHRYRIAGTTSDQFIPNSIAIEFTAAREEIRGGQIAAIRFFHDGSSSGGRIRLRKDGQQIVVEVSWLDGRIRVHAAG